MMCLWMVLALSPGPSALNFFTFSRASKRSGSLQNYVVVTYLSNQQGFETVLATM